MTCSNTQFEKVFGNCELVENRKRAASSSYSHKAKRRKHHHHHHHHNRSSSEDEDEELKEIEEEGEEIQQTPSYIIPSEHSTPAGAPQVSHQLQELPQILAQMYSSKLTSLVLPLLSSWRTKLFLS